MEVIMKAKVIVLVIVLCTVLLGACVGTKALGVLDESVPEGDRCNLEIRNNLAIILYDNQPVNWAPGLTENKVTITLPPGEHSFVARYYVTRSYGSVSESVPVSANISATEFIPGHDYRIYKQSIWLVFVTITSVKIKDVTPKRKA
jgi:hypothetical protein